MERLTKGLQLWDMERQRHLTLNQHGAKITGLSKTHGEPLGEIKVSSNFAWITLAQKMHHLEHARLTDLLPTQQ